MQEIVEYTIENDKYKLKFLNIGAVITEYSINGHNVVLSFEDNNSYLNNSTYLGSVVGRSAGRIRNGQIDGWQLPLNQDGKHNLHGNDLHYKFYDVDICNNEAVLSLEDAEGDFPGNANITIKYSLTDQGLVQEISATSDKPTILNMTNHSYFNLNGTGTILGHELQIESNLVKELDEDLLGVGELDFINTAFDFNNSKKIQEAFDLGHEQFKYSKFIDHPYKINGNIVLKGDNHSLKIETNQDYLVFYAGNYISDELNEIKGNMNKDYHALCLETQQAPGTVDLSTEYKAITKYILDVLQ